MSKLFLKDSSLSGVLELTRTGFGQPIAKFLGFLSHLISRWSLEKSALVGTCSPWKSKETWPGSGVFQSAEGNTLSYLASSAISTVDWGVAVPSSSPGLTSGSNGKGRWVSAWLLPFGDLQCTREDICSREAAAGCHMKMKLWIIWASITAPWRHTIILKEELVMKSVKLKNWVWRKRSRWKRNMGMPYILQQICANQII